jgi:hypothetical protein
VRNTPRTVAIGALTVGVLFAAPSAFAADTVTQDVTGGTLTASVADLGLTSVLSTHAVQHSTGSMTLTADDSTGTGTGWNVTETVSGFAYTGGNGGTAIPATAFSITSAGTTASTTGQAIDATGTQLLPKGPQIGTLTGVSGALDSAVKVLRAGATFGQGTYTQQLNVNLDVPAESRAGTYTGTLTTTVTAAP